jgi:hypothetical protein
MALHRDIHWIGRQWAVTGYGMQAIDQRLGGRFDIEIERLWDQGLPEILSDQKWFNADDFSKGLAIARKRYPGVLRTPEPAPPVAAEPAPPPLPVETILKASAVIAPPPKAVEAAKPEEAAKAAPVTPPKPAPPEDLLGKWFDTFGISRTDSPAPTVKPEPPREVIPPVPEQAVLPDEADAAASHPAPIEPIPPVQEVAMPVTGAVEPPAPASPNFEMPVPGRARFVRPWRYRP